MVDGCQAVKADQIESNQIKADGRAAAAKSKPDGIKRRRQIMMKMEWRRLATLPGLEPGPPP